MPLHPIIIPVPADIQAAKGRPKVQALSRLAREAAQASARKTLGRTISGFPKDDDGVPQPADGVHWSLSHKSALVAGIVAERPIGIDVEYHRPVKSGMHRRIATAEEWLLGMRADAPPDKPTQDAGVPPPDELFYRYWTAKEAVLKAVGKGLVGLSNCHITALPASDRMSLRYHDTPWQVIQRWYADHLVALAYRHMEGRSLEIRWPAAPTMP